MCRQAWFPPSAARNPNALVPYLSLLEKSAGGHGNGAGWVDMETGRYRVEKAVSMSNADAAKMIASRPRGAWGIYHTRLISAGVRDDRGCHPHVYESQQSERKARRLVVLTHNGTWNHWIGACIALATKYPSDSATIAALIADRGWSKIAPAVDQTIIVALREQGKWRIRIWKNSYPLVLLENGGIASEGGHGEFRAARELLQGSHAAEKPRTEPLIERNSGGWRGGFGSTMAETGAWVRKNNGDWVRATRSQQSHLLPGVVPVETVDDDTPIETVDDDTPIDPELDGEDVTTGEATEEEISSEESLLSETEH
jgi:predicted glutamine amidotransferase